jgi:hypothetical protein
MYIPSNEDKMFLFNIRGKGNLRSPDSANERRTIRVTAADSNGLDFVVEG